MRAWLGGGRGRTQSTWQLMPLYWEWEWGPEKRNNSCAENWDLWKMFSTFKAQQESSPVCSLFCKVNFSLRLICCCAAYTTGFNNDLDKLVPFSATLWLLVRVAILCSLLYFRAVYPGLISKGWSFLTAAQFLKKKKRRRGRRRKSLPLLFSAPKSHLQICLIDIKKWNCIS